MAKIGEPYFVNIRFDGYQPAKPDIQPTPPTVKPEIPARNDMEELKGIIRFLNNEIEDQKKIIKYQKTDLEFYEKSSITTALMLNARHEQIYKLDSIILASGQQIKSLEKKIEDLEMKLRYRT